MLTHTTQSRVLNLALAWSLLAFGGVYNWALVPLILTAAVLLAAARPRLCVAGFRVLDLALIAALVVIALQLLPLPRELMAVISPGTVRTWDALSLTPPPMLSVSVWPQATAEALGTAFSAVAVFWAAREIFRFHGIRRVVRTVALAGAIASFAGLLQRKSGSNLVYGFWQPLETGAWPFGPFVNRNSFATWVLMAIPLCAGYLLARRPGRIRHDRRPWQARLAQALDGRAIWLMTVIGLMTVALFACLSRSGVLAFGAVLLVGWAGSRLRRGSRSRGWVVWGAAAVAATVILWGDLPALATRMEQNRALDPRERVAIWRDTIPLVRDHWRAGTGAGAYARAMLLYQTTDRAYYSNHAHNEYLQVAADGGLALVIPALMALLAFGVAAIGRLRQDRTKMFWIRLGAAAGLSGVLAQGVFDTGLHAPANAILSAVLAAILLHEQPATGQPAHTTP